MMIPTINNWYTFREILNIYPELAPTPNSINNTDNWFDEMLQEAGLGVNLVGIDTDGSHITDEKISQYIDDIMNVVFDRQHDNYLYKVVLECGEDYELTEDDFKKAMNKIINVFNLTAPKYIPILYQYERNYENVLRKVESESESFTRFNDTPQNEMDDVDFNTEAYASNMGKSKNVSAVDSNSIPLQLKELQENYKSIILEWSNEFDQIFIDEYQLEEH